MFDMTTVQMLFNIVVVSGLLAGSLAAGVGWVLGRQLQLEVALDLGHTWRLARAESSRSINWSPAERALAAYARSLRNRE